MIIKTKSVQEPAESKDGVRICIMRRIKPEFVFDIWMPPLSPSTELLKEYHDGKISWQQYEVRFQKEVLDTQEKFLRILLSMASLTHITLLCWEETPQMCHRRLVVEALQKIDPHVKIDLT